MIERLILPYAAPEPEGLTSHAAVALIVGPKDELLFIRRAVREGDPWSGDMAFPGGRAERTDRSDRETAERETWEEIGLDLSAGVYVGALPVRQSPLRDPKFGFGIFPFVYRVAGWPAFVPSDEVAAVVPFAMERLLAGEGRGEFRYQGWGVDRVVPCVRLDDTLIWGLTLRMLDDLLERVSGRQGGPDWFR